MGAARGSRRGPVARGATGPSRSAGKRSTGGGHSESEPLSVWSAPLPSRPDWPGVRAERFELASRGDVVPGWLLHPAEGRGPWPLVLLLHGAGGSKAAPYLDAARLPWVRRGVAVASIDLPLHGERANAKLSEQLLAGLAPESVARLAADTAESGERPGDPLYSEFVRQALHDCGRTLDALTGRPDIDGDRVACAAFSLGAILGALFAPAEARLRAAALALAGAGLGPAAFDPARRVAGFAPRPLLFVNALRDERIPRAAAERLHAAAGEPKQVLWFDSGHADLPGRALKAMWEFLARELAI